MLNININDESNILTINKSNRFSNSFIKIKGRNNSIVIEEVKHKIINLNIEFRGDNNKITILSTNKIINNLNISSIRGGNTEVYIDNNFGCGGVDIKMNDGYEKVFFGKDCLLSWGIKIRTSDGHAIVNRESGLAINYPKDIYIGSHVWVGEDVKLLKGTYIPNNCVVGGFSVVTHKFSKENSFSIIAGCPAKIVKKNIDWRRERADEIDNNIRISKYKHIEIAENNKVNLFLGKESYSGSWHTVAIIKNVILDAKTILEINYYYLSGSKSRQFQILLWGKKFKTYFWKPLNFKIKESKQILFVDFSKLLKVGIIDYQDIQYIEIRAKD
jgi:acetyltransferase-like isoleucine patch superfamily enzyme